MEKNRSRGTFIVFLWLGLLILLSIIAKAILLTGNGNLDFARHATTALGGFTALVAGYVVFLYNQEKRKEFIGIKIFYIALASICSYVIVSFGLFYFFI